MNEETRNEIINGFAWGHTAEEIATGMQMSVEDVKDVLTANAEKVQAVKKHIAGMGE